MNNRFVPSTTTQSTHTHTHAHIHAFAAGVGLLCGVCVCVSLITAKVLSSVHSVCDLHSQYYQCEDQRLYRKHDLRARSRPNKPYHRRPKCCRSMRSITAPQAHANNNTTRAHMLKVLPDATKRKPPHTECSQRDCFGRLLLLVLLAQSNGVLNLSRSLLRSLRCECSLAL